MNKSKTPHFGGVSIRVIIPNLVTLLALCLGLTAIRFSFEQRQDMAVLFIIAAAVLDMVDGRIARALKGTSKFGAEFDSLADFVDFGVAPALIMYSFELHALKSLGWVASVTFAIAAALRLARFNVAIENTDKPAWHGNYFVGMPAPAGALVVMLPLYLNSMGTIENGAYIHIKVIYMFVIALLMVSHIPHFSGKNIKRIPSDYVVFILFLAIFILMLLATYTFAVLLVISIAYLLLIPFSIISYRRKKHLT